MPPTKQELIERYGPPDDISGDTTNPTNVEKAEWGRNAVHRFGEHVNGSADADDNAGMAMDLIADVMHFLTMEGCDADEVLSKARWHFEFEVGRGYE